MKGELQELRKQYDAVCLDNAKKTKEINELKKSFSRARNKNWDQEIFKCGHKAGEMDGVLDEATESLERRFTQNELRSIILMVWKSEVIGSLRSRLEYLEKERGKDLALLTQRVTSIEVSLAEINRGGSYGKRT